MGFKMKDFKQQIIKFDYEENFKNEDYYISKNNKHIFDLLMQWPKWDKNFLNISGEKFSGKTHLMNIFINKFQGIKLEAGSLDNEKITEIKFNQNIILENLDEEVDENLVYSLIIQ